MSCSQDETRRLLPQLDAREFGARGGWSPQEFRARIGRYEAATEPLARMAGVLGRWGDGSEFPLALDIIHRPYAHAETIRGGLTAWLNLNSYPAVLGLTAYGLGLTRAQRWATLHDLFKAQISPQNRRPREIVDQLFPELGRDYWMHAEGLERSITPLNDHILNLFSEWGKSFIGFPPDFTLMYERFELLGALAYLEQSDESSVELSLSQPAGASWIRMPVGRIGWDESNQERLTDEIASDPMKATLLAAGFARGSPKFLGSLSPI